ncbi:alpha/beta fold hydrolase [Pararhizobium gei]|uniref:alpha/beta fold hydrolase n=1 Tax=Pararhizobium gei TaxID=1395951 RepID=UPI0023DAF27D|nr:alpha/beta hydrolase [Rhizobium gei]
MAAKGTLEVLFLHALPLDSSMWDRQRDLLPSATYAPTLYPFGESMEEWADAALKPMKSDRLIVVGCSVGGSCALEIAAIAPDRVAALVLIGTKARHRPDPAFHASALQNIREHGLEKAWHTYWQSLFSHNADLKVIDGAKKIALRQSEHEVARGVTVFHTRPSRDQLLRDFVNPIIVISGGDDRAPGPKISAEQADQAQQGRFHAVPECGHYVPLERPATLNTILRKLICDHQ